MSPELSPAIKKTFVCRPLERVLDWQLLKQSSRRPLLSRLGRVMISLILAFGAVTVLVTAPLEQLSAAPPAIKTLVTDRTNLPLGNQFGPANGLVLTNAGDVLFTSGASTALFRWDGGTRTRLLQAGDPHPGFPGSVNEDLVAAAMTVNSGGHAAMTNFFVQKGVRPRRGVFVLDGTTFKKVMLGGDVAPGTGGNTFFNFNQLRINDSDQVACRARLEPVANGPLGLFVGSPTTAPSKIALPGEPAPGTGGGTFASFNLIGFTNAGQVAWISNISGGTTPRAIFVGTPSGISKVVAIGDPAPGTTGTFTGLPNNPGPYFQNDNGDVAFAAGVAGGAPANSGIWIGNGSAPPVKLVLNNDPTGTSLGGNFDGGMRVRGFNNAGLVLFQSDPNAGATSSHALFLKDLANPAQVVFARGQSAPGGTTELLDFTRQAILNVAGQVAFQAELAAGPSPSGWFLYTGGTSIKIALQGEASPIGGTFALDGRGEPARINNSGQVAFFADVIGPNAVGTFLFTPGSGNQSIVTTNDLLPADANPIVDTAFPGASDDELVFYARPAGGRVGIFTAPLHGGNGITRRIGEGDPAPALGGVLWNIDSVNGLINNSEEVAFNANSIVGGSVYPAMGIFTHKQGVGAQKIAATGDAAPGGGNYIDVFLVESRPHINSLGQVVFFADLSATDFGIFIGSAAGGVQKIARAGDPSPFGPGTVVDFPLDVESNDLGQVALGVTIQTPGPVFTNALVVGDGVSPLAKVIAQGDSGPGGGTVSNIHPFLKINNPGQVGYVVNLTGGTSPSALLIGAAGGPQSSVALVNDPAPGTGGGTFSGFDDSTIEVNNPGQVAFFAAVSGSSVTGGFFRGSAIGSPVARLVEGQALPGGGTAGVLTHFFGIVTLIDTGQMSVQLSNINGAPNLFRQVIISPSGALSALVTDGEKAPGTGSTFGESVQAVVSTTQDRLIFSAVMVDGPTKFALFSDK